MANNYLTYSLAVEFPDKETRDKAMAYYDSDEFRVEVMKIEGETDPDNICIDFNCTTSGDTELWISSGDEYGNVEATAALLFWISRHCLNHARLGFQWASTCSKLRIGEHCGGAMWTDGKRQHWIHTSDFLSKAKVVNPS